MASKGQLVLKKMGVGLLFLLGTVVVLALGLVLGYSVLGEGKHPFDILLPSTWMDIFSKF